MNLEQQKLLAREFYEENYDDLLEALWNEEYEKFAPDFIKIANVTIRNLDPLKLEIQRVDPDVPVSVAYAFARHLWYSQWNFANIFLIKILIDRENFFFLFHEGISDDAWDNDTSLVEIFTEQGQFVGATDILFDKLGKMKWREKQFIHEDCRDGTKGGFPPPWTGDEPESVYYHEPLWTEKMLIEQGAKIEKQGKIIRYSLP